MRLTLQEKQEFCYYSTCYNFADQLRGKTILITGANGMTGKGMIKWLLYLNEKFQADITIYASTRSPQAVPDYIDKTDNIIFCRYGEESICLENKRIDYIIHSAAPTGRDFFINYPVETLRVIIDATEKLLDLAKNNPNCRFLYLSSMDIYGTINEKEPVKEDYVSAIDTLNIRNGYPLGKKAAEFLCHAYYQEYGVDTVIIRPASIQGLFQSYDEPRVFNEILRCIIEEKDFVIKSRGIGKKCFLYSLDAIAAIFTVLIKGESNEVYNATDPDTFISLNELADMLFKRFCPEKKIIHEESGESGYLPEFSFVQDNEKIEHLGWKPLRKIPEIYEIDIKRFTDKK